MRIIEKKYMFNQCLHTLIQNGPDLHKLFSQFSKFFNIYFLNVTWKHDYLRLFDKIVYNIRVRSVSVYTDTRTKHSCLYTLIQNGHSFCKHNLQT